MFFEYLGVKIPSYWNMKKLLNKQWPSKGIGIDLRCEMKEQIYEYWKQDSNSQDMSRTFYDAPETWAETFTTNQLLRKTEMKTRL